MTRIKMFVAAAVGYVMGRWGSARFALRRATRTARKKVRKLDPTALVGAVGKQLRRMPKWSALRGHVPSKLHHPGKAATTATTATAGAVSAGTRTAGAATTGAATAGAGRVAHSVRSRAGRLRPRRSASRARPAAAEQGPAESAPKQKRTKKQKKAPADAPTQGKVTGTDHTDTGSGSPDTAGSRKPGRFARLRAGARHGAAAALSSTGHLLTRAADKLAGPEASVDEPDTTRTADTALPIGAQQQEEQPQEEQRQEDQAAEEAGERTRSSDTADDAGRRPKRERRAVQGSEDAPVPRPRRRARQPKKPKGAER